MAKQIETITCVDCPYCGVKILQTWRTDKKLSEVEVAERGDRSLRNHIELHEEANKYQQLSTYVRRMAEITGGYKYGD